jgi:hypothetical protein
MRAGGLFERRYLTKEFHQHASVGEIFRVHPLKTLSWSSTLMLNPENRPPSSERYRYRLEKSSPALRINAVPRIEKQKVSLWY